MSTTTYSAGRVIVEALRKLTNSPEGEGRIRRLEDGTAEPYDLGVAIWTLTAGGREDLARELGQAAGLVAAASGEVVALRDAGTALDEAFAEWEAADVAMSEHNGSSDMEAYEDSVRLDAAERAYQQAIVDHARAVADLAIAQAEQLAAVAADVRAIRAHLEAGR